MGFQVLQNEIMIFIREEREDEGKEGCLLALETKMEAATLLSPCCQQWQGTAGGVAVVVPCEPGSGAKNKCPWLS